MLIMHKLNVIFMQLMVMLMMMVLVTNISSAVLVLFRFSMPLSLGDQDWFTMLAWEVLDPLYFHDYHYHHYRHHHNN